MIYVPLKHLKPGMVVAQDVTHGASFFSLIVNGQALTPCSIHKLEKHNVAGIYIHSKLLDGVKVNGFISSEFKQKTIVELKKIYDDFTNQKLISVSTINSFSKIAESLIQLALSKDECLINVIDIKDYDTYTYTHSMYVSILSVLIGIRCGYPRSMLNELAMCGLLHDVGKVEIPLEIVNKPGPLTDDEFGIMKMHPKNAVTRLTPYCNMTAKLLCGIGSHHERYDGTGYPNGLIGDKIPLYSRVLALADVYDALTSSRSYRQAWSSSDTIEYMMGSSGHHFDHQLLQVFLKTVAAYPIGTIVTLSNQYRGVVTKNSVDNCLRPTVRLFEPALLLGTDIDLFADANYLNVTIVGTFDENNPLPDSVIS